MFEGCDSNMGGIQLAAQELGGFERARGLGGERFQDGDALAELIDFEGPASLVHLFAVFSELGALAKGTDFALELCVVDCGGWDWLGVRLS